MDQIITLNKTFQDRLSEYKVVFGEVKLLPVSELKKQWSIYLELELDDKHWQAFWEIPRTVCKKNNIPYPTTALVNVCSIQYDELIAFVEIIAMLGDTELNCFQYTASLTKLWPTKHQPNGIHALSLTNTLDKLKFFYNHVLMPWDFLEKQNNTDSNLEDRLQLYFNIKDGILPKNKTAKLRILLSEIRNELENIDDITHLKLDPLNQEQAELNCKIIELKFQYELLQILQRDNNYQQGKTPNNWLIFENKSCLKDLIEYLKSITATDKKYKCSTSLNSVLEEASANDVIYVNKGKHIIHSSGILEDGVIIKSVSTDPHKTIIDTIKENSLIDFFGNNLLIENLHFNISKARCAIITHSGQITLKNCIISGHHLSEHAIIALPGSEMILENCKISGFNVGIYASQNSILRLINCNISDVCTAIKLFDNSTVCLRNCTFSNFSQNCVYLDTKKDIGDNDLCGNYALLKMYSDVDINDCKFDTSHGNYPVIVISNKKDIFLTNI